MTGHKIFVLNASFAQSLIKLCSNVQKCGKSFIHFGHFNSWSVYPNMLLWSTFTTAVFNQSTVHKVTNAAITMFCG